MMNEKALVQRLAANGFLKKYIDCFGATTDAPRLFLLAVALTILAAAMGNSVVIPAYGGIPLHPNLWIVLVALSGFLRKTTVIRQGRNLLEQAVPKRLLPDEWTPEKLVEILADQSLGLLIVHEFSRLLQMMARDYMAGAREMLAELFDSPSSYTAGTIKRGLITVRGAAISVLGATTEDWLHKCVKGEDLRGGLLPRFLFLPAQLTSPRVLPGVSPDPTLLNDLISHLRAVAQIKGPADFSQVVAPFDGWLKGYETRIVAAGIPAEYSGLYSRSGAYALKLAVVFQMAEQPTLQIGSSAVENATIFLESVHELTRAVTERFSDSWVGKQRIVVLDLLARNEPMTRSQFLRACRHLTARQLTPILETLVESGEIVGEPETSGKRTYSVYRLA